MKILIRLFLEPIFAFHEPNFILYLPSLAPPPPGQLFSQFLQKPDETLRQSPFLIVSGHRSGARGHRDRRGHSKEQSRGRFGE